MRAVATLTSHRPAPSFLFRSGFAWQKTEPNTVEQTLATALASIMREHNIQKAVPIISVAGRTDAGAQQFLLRPVSVHAVIRSRLRPGPNAQV